VTKPYRENRDPAADDHDGRAGPRDAESRPSCLQASASRLRTAAAQPNPWPVSGLEVGDLSRGQTIVFDVDVDRPAGGGGLVSFSVAGSADGVALSESVGVYVGEPAVKPVVRDGVIEYPAEGQGSDR
jgi:hypothetical protein